MTALITPSPRKIIHIDMDAFYASVEQRDFPELRGKPLVVGGDPNGRGVVAAASYEVRKFGVRSAMSCYEARKRCPDVIFVKPRFDVYRAVSQDIRRIMHSLTPQVEPLSLDEAYLDVTGLSVHHGSATLMANWLRAQILEQTGLNASAGVSFNKMLAKIASDINKPNGTAVITPADAEAFISTLPIERFHGIGKATAKALITNHPSSIRHIHVPTLVLAGKTALQVVADCSAERKSSASTWDEILLGVAQPWQLDLARDVENAWASQA